MILKIYLICVRSIFPRFVPFSAIENGFGFISSFAQIFLMAKFATILLHILISYTVNMPLCRNVFLENPAQISGFFHFSSIEFISTCSGTLIGFHYLKCHKMPEARNIRILMRYYDGSYCDCEQFIKTFFRFFMFDRCVCACVVEKCILHEIRESLEIWCERFSK